MFRIGYGTDIHRLVENRPFFIGGILIPFHKGSLGHSDADVLIHAICDAILGALALGDIGSHFPDTDEKYRNINSEKLLSEVVTLMKTHGYSIVNLDSTINLQNPKLSPHIHEIRKNLSKLMECPVEKISVKAKTAEGLGSIGNAEAVSAEVITLISLI